MSAYEERLRSAVRESVSGKQETGGKDEAIEALARAYPNLSADDIESLLDNAQEGADEDPEVIAEAAFEKMDAYARLKSAVDKGTDPMNPEAREAAADLADTMNDEDVTANKVIDAVQNIRQAEDREADKAVGAKAAERFRQNLAEKLDGKPDDPFVNLSAGIREKLGLDRKAWVPYEGPQGGSGWKNTDTGEVSYDDEPPGQAATAEDIAEGNVDVADLASDPGEAVAVAEEMGFADALREDLAAELGLAEDASPEAVEEALAEDPGAMEAAMVSAADAEAFGGGDEAARDAVASAVVGGRLEDAFESQEQSMELADHLAESLPDELPEGGEASAVYGSMSEFLNEEGIAENLDTDEAEALAQDIADEWGGGGGVPADTSDMPLWDSMGEELAAETHEEYNVGGLADAHGAEPEEVMQVYEDIAERRMEGGDRTAPSPGEFESMVADELGGSGPENPDALPGDLSGASAADLEGALADAYPGEGQMSPEQVNDAWDRMGAAGEPPDWLADGAYPGDLAMEMTQGSGAGEPTQDQVNDAAAVVADEVGGPSLATYDDVSEIVSSDRFADVDADRSQLVDKVAEQLGIDRDEKADPSEKARRFVERYRGLDDG